MVGFCAVIFSVPKMHFYDISPRLFWNAVLYCLIFVTYIVPYFIQKNATIFHGFLYIYISQDLISRFSDKNAVFLDLELLCIRHML